MFAFESRGLSRRRMVVAAGALGVFVLSIYGLAHQALAHRQVLPGFEEYDVAVGRDVAVAPDTPEVALEQGADRFAAPVKEITIPAIRISAPVVPMGVRADGYMDLPNSPHDVAWYYFSSKPGMGGNAVFSAHVDYIDYGPAVFWNLSKLRPDDSLTITLKDGTALQYSVAESYTVPLVQLDMAELLAPTDSETVTLITCGGTYSNGNYSHRVIVRASRTSTLPRAVQ